MSPTAGFVDTFTRWTEAIPTRTERATEVAKYLLKETLPRLGYQEAHRVTVGPLL